MKKFNQTIENPYRENWGSTLSYLNSSQTIGGKKFDEVDIFNRMTEHNKKLDETNKTKKSKSELQKFKKAYGSTRNAIPGGRSVPKTKLEETTFGQIEQRTMQIQNLINQPGIQKNSKFEIQMKSTVSTKSSNMRIGGHRNSAIQNTLEIKPESFVSIKNE